MAADFYETLDVHADADAAELKRAYRKRLRATHPDTGGDAAEFRAVQEAWETLGDEQRRALYDRRRTTVGNPFMGGQDFFATSTAAPAGEDPFVSVFTESMAERVRREAQRLYEQNAARQRRIMEQERELAELSRPLFPLSVTEWGLQITRLYARGHIWGITFPQLQRWKVIDIWIIRSFFIALVLVNALVIGLASTHGSGSLLSTIALTSFLDLVAFFLLCLAGVGAVIYRFMNYGLKRKQPQTRTRTF